MRLPEALALALLAPLAGCGLTFGVDAVESVTDVELEPGDAAAFAIVDTGVDDRVVVCGGNDTVAAHVSTVDWRGDGDASPARVELVRDGDTIRLELGGGGESVTLKGIEADIPTDMATSLEIVEGNLTVCDLAATVDATVGDGTATLRDIAAPATIRARSVKVDNAMPIDLLASGDVDGTLASGGSVLASGTVRLDQTGYDIDSLDIDSDSGATESSVTLYLPPDGDWTIFIESSGGGGFIDVGNVAYDSTDEDAPPVSDGIEVDIGAGGPPINVTTNAATIFILENASP